MLQLNTVSVHIGYNKTSQDHVEIALYHLLFTCTALLKQKKKKQR